MSNAVLQPRHGFSLFCEQCGIRKKVGGIESAKQFAEIIAQETKPHNQHKERLLIKQSYHAAELAHQFVEQTTKQTGLGTTFATVSGMTILNANLTAGKKYLIIATAQAAHETSAGNQTRIKIVHGSTDFDDSSWEMEPNTVGTAWNLFSWFTVWTAVSGESLTLQAGTNGGTLSVDQATLIAIKLSDDLTEDTGSGGDWKYNEATANVNLATSDSSTSNSTITFTPAVASQDWLIMSKSRIPVTTTTGWFGSRIVRSGEASSTAPFTQLGGEDATNDKLIHHLACVKTLGNASNTFTEKSFASGSVGTRSHSGIFALNLNKLKNHNFSYADGSVTAYGAQSTLFQTQIATTTITPDVTGDVWCFSFLTSVLTAAGIHYQARMQVYQTGQSQVDQPATQTSDGYALMESWHASDESIFTIQSMESLTAATGYTLDLDASVETTAAGRGARAKLVMFATMELPGAALVKVPTADTVGISEATTRITGKIRAPTSETVGITEAATRITGKIRAPTSETVGISEAVSRFESKTRIPTADVVGISEAIRRSMIKLRAPTTETVGISETVRRRKSIARTDQENPNPDYISTDFLSSDYLTSSSTIAIYEQVLALLGKVRVPASDVVGITEQVLILLSKVRIPASDVIGISESVSAIMSKVRAPTTDTVGIYESVSRLSSKVRVSDTETIGISESISRLSGRTKVSDTDTVGISETVGRSQNKVRVSPTDTVGISESINWLEGKVRITPTDTVGISENVQKVLTNIENLVLQTVSDTVGISESVLAVKQSTIIKIVNDVIGISESVGISRLLIRQVQELIGVSETVNRLENLVRIVSEQEGITENTPHLKSIIKLISDTIGITETTQALTATPRQKQVTDTVGISESVLAVLELAPVGAVFRTPLSKRGKQQAPRYRQRLIEPFREITREELDREKKEKEKEPTPELRTTVVSSCKFRYNIESSAVYQETKKIKDALSNLSNELVPEFPDTQPESYSYTYPEPSIEPKYPITSYPEQLGTISTPQLQPETKIEEPKYKSISSSLKFKYEVKDSVLYNKLLKYARLLDTLDLVDKLDQIEKDDDTTQNEMEVLATS